MAPSTQEKHVFISYVHENSDEVDKLCAVLDAVNVPYWRDRSKLGPGDEWKAKIREAIRSGSMAFLACFSNESRAKDRTHMNEELTLACEEWRLRPPGRTWLIPVRFDDGPLPEFDLGVGKTLSDLNYTDLFGPSYNPNMAQLIEKLKEVMGLSPVLDPAVIRTAVDEATGEQRPALLRQLTKDMIRDPSRDIELDDLISQEVAHVVAALRDSERFPTSSKSGTNSELVIGAAETATDYWHLVEPFCWSLQIAARYATPQTLTPWVKGLRALCTEALKIAGGNTYLIHLRHVPSLIAVFVAAMAAGGQGKWDNYKSLLIDPKVANPYHDNLRFSLIQTVSPWGTFEGEGIPQLLAHAAKQGADFATAQSEIDAGQAPRYHTPIAEWLNMILRPMFNDQFPDNQAYDAEFDAAEVMIGLVYEDLGLLAAKDEPTRPYYLRNKWYGRSTWRGRKYDNPLRIFADDLANEGPSAPPLAAGLFGGSVERATEALNEYSPFFNELGTRYSF